MSDGKVVVTFTAKSVAHLLKEGGTCNWRLNRKNARQREFAICTRNAKADWVEGQEEHHAAFLVGRIKDVVLTSWAVIADSLAAIFAPPARPMRPDSPVIWRRRIAGCGPSGSTGDSASAASRASHSGGR